MTGIIVDIEGIRLDQSDRSILQDERVKGVILFSRNFESVSQVCALVQEIRDCVGRPFLISVDHEGGRVQRFREGFTAIPAMASILTHANSLEAAQADARELGWLMAIELRELDIDLSYAPVLDVYGDSTVIGDRAFAKEPAQIIPLTRAFIEGMRQAGMRCVGKHFPGHGTVVADSHIDIPVDDRPEEDISAWDLQPFKALAPVLDAVMPAHVIYSQVDELPAGFSPYWLQTVLRQRLGFGGVIISDDLLMEGARVVGDVPERARAAFAAGGDLLLVCNNRAAALDVLSEVEWPERQRDAASLLLGLPVAAPSQERLDAARALAAQLAS
ncbi:MAG: beta-N-acetylhexosaminidase [Idiomarina sp.]|nr:beta-N-acetylhexosaminidase [Idiomarina sp.]